MQAGQLSIKTWLDEIGFSNKSGGKIALSQVFLILNNTFYYGQFEYPEDSGKIYKGAHAPLVTKELFQQVQESRLIPSKAKWGTKSFAFKSIFKCASCGSEITAEEKFKALKDGSLRRHVYYHCTRQISYDCQEKYINETDLINGLVNYIGEHSEEIKVSDETARLAVRHAEVVERSLAKRHIETEEIDPLTEYAEFILNYGTHKEQGKFISSLETRFTIHEKTIHIA